MKYGGLLVLLIVAVGLLSLAVLYLHQHAASPIASIPQSTLIATLQPQDPPILLENTEKEVVIEEEPQLKDVEENVEVIQEVRKPPIRIAYLFAGSLRSFICPKVHWSIRMNAIDAFGGEAYTFIRVSFEDNANIHKGDGKLLPSQYRNEEEVQQALKILNPRKVVHFNLSTQLEEMQRLFPSTTHRVFQNNDLRRYSMYFHRSMAYHMALDYEQTHDLRFDWVVMIRLDTAWLEPVLPIQYYANDRVWLTETGYVALNDQFMLVPRRFSDHVFDLDSKVQRGVYCLGGPDVEKWKCNRTELERRDVTAEMVDATLDRCCTDLLTSDMEGFSERIHMRHLRAGSIPISLGRFLVYINRIRRNGKCYAECGRLHYHFKFHSMESLDREYPFFAPLHPLDKTHVSVLGIDSTKCAYLHHDAFEYKPLSAREAHQLTVEGAVKPLNFSQSLYAQFEAIPPSIPVNPANLHLWMIHPTRNVDGCLSVNFTSSTFYWRDCEYHDRGFGGRRFVGDQTFFLHVDPPQRSMLRDPMLRRSDAVFHYEDFPSPNKTRVVMYARHPKTMDMMNRVLCLAVKKSEVVLQQCSPRGLDADEWFRTVHGAALGSHVSSTVGYLRSWQYPDKCIMHSGDVLPHPKKPSAVMVGQGALSVGHCSDRTAAAPGRTFFEFQLVTN